MATDYGKRLRAARKHAKLTQEKLSEITGIAQSTISTAEREGNGSTSNAILAGACGVSPHWLETGEGEMLEKDRAYTSKFIAYPDANEQAAPANSAPEAINNIATTLERMRLLVVGADDLARDQIKVLLVRLCDQPERGAEIMQNIARVLDPVNTTSADQSPVKSSFFSGN